MADEDKPVKFAFGGDAPPAGITVEEHADGSVTITDKNGHQYTMGADGEVSIKRATPLAQVDLEGLFEIESVTTKTTVVGSQQVVRFRDGDEVTIHYGVLGEVSDLSGSGGRYRITPENTIVIGRKPPPGPAN